MMDDVQVEPITDDIATVSVAGTARCPSTAAAPDR
jgi:hypothetical protein